MKKIYVVILTIVLTFSFELSAQVAINTDGSSADGTAILDVKSTSQGLLIPRMSTFNRTDINSPANGLLVFDTDSKGLWFYSTSYGWIKVYDGATTIGHLSDADGDTRVEVEYYDDEDLIRMYMGDMEYFKFDGAHINVLNSGNSVFIGEDAGLNDDYSGNNNVAIGADAFVTSTSSYNNTAVGSNAMNANTTGNANTAYGERSLFHNNIGYSNTAVGGMSSLDNTSGIDNVAIGYGALLSNVANSHSTAVGSGAMYYADDRTSGRNTFNTAVGYSALKGSTTAANNTGRYNTAIGDAAMLANTNGDNNVAVGSSSLAANTSGNNNVAVGSSSLIINTYGYNNVALGYSALSSNTGGDENTAIGNGALFSNVANGKSTAIGNEAMYYADNSTSPKAVYNTAIGWGALKGSTTPSNNTGYSNTAVGAHSLSDNTDGSSNVAIGYSALGANTEGSSNVAIGHTALNNNTTGGANTAIGSGALNSSISASSSTAIGLASMDALVSGTNNTAIGENSFSALSSGSYNLALGGHTAINLTSGSSNIFIGYNVSAPVTTGSNQLNIGNTIYGTGIYQSTQKIGIGVQSPDEVLDVRGNLQVKQTLSEVSANIESTTNAATLFIKSSGSNLGQITFFDNGVYGGSFGYSNDNDRFFIWHGSNNIFIDNGNLLPGVHKGGDLGANGQAWDDVWCDDIRDQGAAAFVNRNVAKEIVNYPPKEKTAGSFDYKTDRGQVELDPSSLPEDLYEDNSILIDEVATYNYKANYEQQLQINELKRIIEQQNKKIEQLIKLVSEK